MLKAIQTASISFCNASIQRVLLFNLSNLAASVMLEGRGIIIYKSENALE